MSTNNQELLRSQNSSDETPKHDYNSELINRERIEGTPFTIIEDKEKGYYITMGNYLITHPTKTKTEQIEKLHHLETWNIILTMIIIVINKQMGNE